MLGDLPWLLTQRPTLVSPYLKKGKVILGYFLSGTPKDACQSRPRSVTLGHMWEFNLPRVAWVRFAPWRIILTSSVRRRGNGPLM